MTARITNPLTVLRISCGQRTSTIILIPVLWLCPLYLNLVVGQETDKPAPSIAGSSVDTDETEYARELSSRLSSDEADREAVADRIYRSSLGERFSSSQDPSAAREEIAKWIKDHPEDAAHLAIGFAKDDAAGSHQFEDQLYNRIIRQFELNPGRFKGLLGILMEASVQSKLIIKQDKMSGEEQRELLKRLFEGKDSAQGTVLNPPKELQKDFSQAPAVTARLPDAGFYDRLSAENPTGYSPNVVAFQSALNLRRVPGAPRLIETGKLDYQTLIFPYYLLRYDIGRLANQLKSHQSWVEQHYGEGTRGKDAPLGKKLKSGLERRKKFLANASKALEELRTLAEAAKNPARITPTMLRKLGAKQLEAARWITAASIEEDLERMESVEDFFSEELKRQIREAPAADKTRNGYLNEGERIVKRLNIVKDSDSQAVSMIEGGNFEARRADVNKLLDLAAAVRIGLFAHIDFYTRVPYQLNAAWRPLPKWRQWINKCARRLFPNSSYVKSIDFEERDFNRLLEAFIGIAASDYSSAKKLFLK